MLWTICFFFPPWRTKMKQWNNLEDRLNTILDSVALGKSADLSKSWLWLMPFTPTTSLSSQYSLLSHFLHFSKKKNHTHKTKQNQNKKDIHSIHIYWPQWQSNMWGILMLPISHIRKSKSFVLMWEVPDYILLPPQKP